MSSLQVYIHHPDDIPIELNPVNPSPDIPRHCGRIGLICHSTQQLHAGSPVRLSIPFIAPHLSVCGLIDWCRRSGPTFELGIHFCSSDAVMRIRMLEQMCQIYHYRRLSLRYGRPLSNEDAAQEWVARYAALFPANGV